MFDWGGGTLDLTLCRLERGMLTQIENSGDRTVGGDQFDQILFNLVRSRHEKVIPSSWGRIQHGANSKLMAKCEEAKIRLSKEVSYTIFVLDILAVEGRAKNIEVVVTRDDFRHAVEKTVKSGLDKIDELLEPAGIDRGAIKFCLGTGGMVYASDSGRTANQVRHGSRKNC